MAQIADFILSADGNPGFVVHVGQLPGNPDHLVEGSGQAEGNPVADAAGNKEQQSQPQKKE
ncbi:hypothetical protein D3C86_2050500 [compost metagenome]